MATNPCDTCAHYDPIIGRRDTPARHGRCGAKSTYPAIAQAGQTFPAGAPRAAVGEPCKPVIVIGAQTVASCADYRAKPKKKKKSV